MANQLKMAKVHAIRVLRERGWSYRRIARELGIHRETVTRCLALARGSPSKPAKVITGSPGSRSRCEPFREMILGRTASE